MENTLVDIMIAIVVAYGTYLVLGVLYKFNAIAKRNSSTSDLTEEQKKQLEELLVLYKSLVTLQDHMSKEDIQRYRHCFLQLGEGIYALTNSIGGESADLYMRSKICKGRMLIIDER